MKKVILTDILFLRKKKQEALEKKHGCKFIEINTSNAKNGYDLDYEVVAQKHLLMKKIEQKNKRTRRQNKRKRRKVKQKNKRTRSQNKRTRRQK